MVEHGVVPCTLEEVLSQSDFVSMHAPARPEVHHMLGETHFRQMKPSAIFINTGRGATVNGSATTATVIAASVRIAAINLRRCSRGSAAPPAPTPMTDAETALTRAERERVRGVPCGRVARLVASPAPLRGLRAHRLLR